jgi:large subunit ribosomal protein L13
MMKTYSVKLTDIKREMHVVDAADKILGRVATEIAALLMGKHKAMFSRNADVGDSVTVINAEKVQVTGKKAQQKNYYRHSNYPGGMTITSYEKMMAEHPDRIVWFAVDGMIPQNHLHDRMLKRLKVYAGPVPSRTKISQAIEEKAEVKKITKKSVIRKVAVKQEVVAKKEAKR